MENIVFGLSTHDELHLWEKYSVEISFDRAVRTKRQEINASDMYCVIAQVNDLRTLIMKIHLVLSYW